MTAKRFTINMEDECIDDAKNEIFIDFNDRIDFNQLCELLNELHSRNKRLEEKIQRERTSFTKTHERWSKGVETKIKELSEENEQLLIEKDTIQKQHSYEIDKKLEYKSKLIDLKKENKQLKAQLYCDDEEGVCNICKYHYLVKDDEVELGYYTSRCKKGHYECARVSLKHCEDFEKEL